jgi:hypothetical protein
MITHGGYGAQPGLAFCEIESAADRVAAKGGDDKDFLHELTQVFNREFFSDLRCQRSMWQMMLGGVFDRHPDLVLVMSEVRADWLPSTLRHLDAVYDEARSELRARRKPSEVWQSNCVAVASFIHRSEVVMRHEIGVDTMCFGRDYPHFEGTWPNTASWIADAFAGVPEREVRLMLGENLIRAFHLDRAHLASVADRVGLPIETVTGGMPTPLDPRLLANFHSRGGYLKPIEQFDRGAIDDLLHEDVVHAARSHAHQ